jgi:hypothetical protein
MLDVQRLDCVKCTTALEVELLGALIIERRLRSRMKERVKVVIKEVPALPPPEPEPGPIAWPFGQDSNSGVIPLDYLPANAANVRQIVKAASDQFNVSIEDIKSDRRQAPIMRARHATYLLCKILTRRSYPDIGRQLGGRDHTTILSGVRKLAWLEAELVNELSRNDTIRTWVRVTAKKMFWAEGIKNG